MFRRPYSLFLLPRPDYFYRLDCSPKRLVEIEHNGRYHWRVNGQSAHSKTDDLSLRLPNLTFQ